MCVCLCACVCLGVFSAATKNSRNIMAPNLLSFKRRKERRKGQWYLLYIQMSNTLYVGSESCFTWTNRWKKFTAHTLQFVKLAFGGRLFIFVTLYILIQSQCRLARAEGKSKNFGGWVEIELQQKKKVLILLCLLRTRRLIVGVFSIVVGSLRYKVPLGIWCHDLALFK